MHSYKHRARSGSVLTLVVLLLPMFVVVGGLLIDGAMLFLAERRTQNICDAAATAAATQLRLGNSAAAATSAAQAVVVSDNGASDASVTVLIPPTSGAYAGLSTYAEVHVQQPVKTYLINALSGGGAQTAGARSVAGYEHVDAGASIVVLDPNPAQFAMNAIPITLPLSLPSLLSGLEMLGVGNITVNGGIHVNTAWGGIDQSSLPVGTNFPPPWGVSAMPSVPTVKLYCPYLGVVGGVDSLINYAPLTGHSTPVHADRLPVPDPFTGLAVPSTATDPSNVSATYYGGKTIVGLPLITTTLQPGVYDYINVVTGSVKFNPGVYIIRGTNANLPSLNLVAGQIQANGVMFYLTNTANYSATSGLPDADDGETQPANTSLGTLIPSAIINFGLTGSSFSALSSPGSPFNGMLIYQRRQDRRPVVLIQETLLGSGTAIGTVYAKWGHVLLAGVGSIDARLVAGTMRLVAILDLEINTSSLLPAASDVFLTE